MGTLIGVACGNYRDSHAFEGDGMKESRVNPSWTTLYATR